MAQQIDVNNNFPEGFYEEFARLVIAFGRLEYMIKLCLKDLLGQGFTKGMAEAESKIQFKRLCDEARNQARTRLCPMQAESLCKLINQAIDLGDYRNDTIHALWTIDETDQPSRVRPKWDKKKVEWSRGGLVAVGELQAKRQEMEQIFQGIDVARKLWSKSSSGA